MRNEHFVSTKTFWFPNKMLNSSPVVVVWWRQRFTCQGPVKLFSEHNHKHLNWTGLVPASREMSRMINRRQMFPNHEPVSVTSRFLTKTFTAFLDFSIWMQMRSEGPTISGGSESITVIKHDKINTDRVKVEHKLAEFSVEMREEGTDRLKHEGKWLDWSAWHDRRQLSSKQEDREKRRGKKDKEMAALHTNTLLDVRGKISTEAHK